MEFTQYIEPGLMVLIPVLYCVGMGLKRMETFNDRYIPFMLGIAGVILCCMAEIIALGWSMNAIYAGIIQGVLVAAGAVYANNLVKQALKTEE